jgi:hypothetical protein
MKNGRVANFHGQASDAYAHGVIHENKLPGTIQT